MPRCTSVLGKQIWEAWQQGGQTSDGRAFVNKQAFGHYGAVLHDSCRQTDDAVRAERAWFETHQWLMKRAPHMPVPHQQDEDVVQEALIRLGTKLREKPLRVPRAFFATATQTLKRTAIDLFRTETAVKRGGNEPAVSLEDWNQGPGDGEGAGWEEKLPSQARGNKRPTETTVANEEIAHQIATFFEKHLNSKLQVKVAQLHFLGGLSPKEIAELWNWTPARVRVRKAEVVKRLRALPEKDREKLMSLLAYYGERADGR
ncbi:MAG: sigma-70 family RNA polymerase sigma factor [Chloroflexota bacterium]